MSRNPVVKESFFTKAQIDKDISEFCQMLLVGERVHDFMSTLFETEQDGQIEFYEFLDLLIVLKTASRPLNRTHLKMAMDTARKGDIIHPWSFDTNGVCSMSGVLDVVGKVFKDLDKDVDGTLDKREVYGLCAPSPP
jgi:hypothetical protein